MSADPLDNLAARQIIAEEIAEHVRRHHGAIPLTRLDPERLTTISNILRAVEMEMERLKVEILREAALTAARMDIAHSHDEHEGFAIPRRRRTRKQIALQREIDATLQAALDRGEGQAS